MGSSEEKITELMKKAKDFIPDGGYSEKELNLAFFMFIKGYHQAEKDLELTWEDILLLADIEQDVFNHSDSPLKGVQAAYEEVLECFKKRKEK